MSELEIPDRAYAAADASLGDEHAVIRAAAPIIVAAELRRLAGKGQGTGPFRSFEQELLLARADQLDPQ